MQIELAQIPVVDGHVAPNLARVTEVIRARRDGTDLIVFPETTLTGFPTRENVRELAEPLAGASIAAVREAARAAGVGVAVGFAERDGGRFFNTTVLVDAQGEIVLRYRKTHLWASDVGVFEPGDRYAVCEFKGLTVGLLICYDIEFPETARAVASLGADLLIVTNGNMEPFGPVHRRAIVARAMENQMFAALVNRIGSGDDDLSFPGESALISPSGDVLSELHGEDAVLCATLDPALLAASREHYSYLHDARVRLELREDPAGDAEPHAGRGRVIRAR
ncbi:MULTISPECIES: carbon-nitrogen hydrolase family protein [Burkholderia]|uniref:Carbon-nitrogen hydrolase n=1 Tax=Burkholderia gladioli TaxID=28095 RepID=A0A2A7SEA5_BURGA|nr:MULTISPECIES: carbon-nitrogen hydrolase family protein [Burkholderia]ATF90070.1 carbon-nitrogen hydrolase [Burkholderia gladioli pv. gladioli]MBJ9715957.1 carbon-nitrogen hydrolase family protein [Burkholderia gladioli]MBU9156994.1 carbon-nitrogen hydrolase family protein [Burkholderia gladioli]MBU9167074.1 carbon-nitrogen hydrolase family protein [Burkholderia gladioli]MBU9193133.1 carbon-nitrogen hydrolase family protein [Burkholderia gladioli]